MPDNDASGILQDIHWSIGAIGYFATYTLGNLISAQLWNAFGRAQSGSRRTRSRAGDFSPLLAWLRTNVHQFGRKYQPQELVQRVTGSRIDPEPYLQYLESEVQTDLWDRVGLRDQASGLPPSLKLRRTSRAGKREAQVSISQGSADSATGHRSDL